MSIRASPATTSHATHRAGADVPLHRWIAAPMPASCSTGRWMIRRPCAATCATWAGSTLARRRAAVARRGRCARRRPSAADVLDVGTGGADIPLALLARADGRGRTLARDASTAGRRSSRQRRAETRVGATAGPRAPRRRRAGAPLRGRLVRRRPRSLVIHHLEPGEAVLLLREMARVARLGVVVNDLDRGRLGWRARGCSGSPHAEPLHPP